MEAEGEKMIDKEFLIFIGIISLFFTMVLGLGFYDIKSRNDRWESIFNISRCIK